MSSHQERNIFCTQCGAQLLENSLFCHKCGSKISELQESSVTEHDAFSTKRPQNIDNSFLTQNNAEQNCHQHHPNSDSTPAKKNYLKTHK